MRRTVRGESAAALIDRAAAPETAPPQGLFLMKVFYSPEERDSFRLESLPFC